MTDTRPPAAPLAEEALPLPGQLSRLAALHRINRAATASLDLEELLGKIPPLPAPPRPRAPRMETALPLPGHFPRLATLPRVTGGGTASLDLEEMLGTVVRVVAQVVGADSCTVCLYSPEEDRLTVRATAGLNPDAVGAVSLPLGTGITGQAARTRTIIEIGRAHV